MTTLVDKAILSGADNHPPMLEKDMYDSWKSIMELYMMNRQHGRMILESVENGPLIWPSIEENGVTRPKKYSELSATEAIQADCDIKATNIILQGLPPEVYALVSNHKVAKELWARIQLLMQGTSLTKQERECKLYDEFDKFAYKKGETLREFYLRFSLLLNDMNIYNMKLEQFQVNTKFLNTLPPEWSKFVTDVKLVRDLHTTNVDQLHAYLGQHEFHANEVRLMHERNSDPLALSLQYGSLYQSQQYSTHQSSTPLSITLPSNDYQSSVHHNVYSPSSSIPQLEYAPTVNQQPEFSQLDSSLIVPVFQEGDDPIDAINHMMFFLTAVGIRNVSPNGVFGNEVYGGDSEGFGVNPSIDEFRLCNSDEWRSGNHGGRVIITSGIRNVSPNGVFGNEVYGGDSEGFGVNPSSDEFRLCNSDEWRSINGGGPLLRVNKDSAGENSAESAAYLGKVQRTFWGIRNVSTNGVYRNEVYGGDSEGFGVNPSSDEFRLCNSDEWMSINDGGPLKIRGYGGSGDMVDQKGCLDDRTLRSSPFLPSLQLI
ncbi:hypothetical protein Tco_0827881 [Tanacetum coccineum]